MLVNDLSTSELITIARNYSASIKEIGIYSELVKELTTRLAVATAAANEGCKHAALVGERLAIRLEEKAAQFEHSAYESEEFIADNRYKFAAAMFRGFAAELRKGAAV